MSYFQQKAAPLSIGPYQISGIPYLSSSISVPASGSATLLISFPTISQEVTVRNQTATGSVQAPLRVGIEMLGAQGLPNKNYVVLANGESITMRWRITGVHLMGDGATAPTGSVVASLTGIMYGTDYTFSGTIGVG